MTFADIGISIDCKCFGILLTLSLCLGFDKAKIFQSNEEDTCFPDKKRGVYVARTEYNILMHDSKNEDQKWNVTFFDYSSLAMGKEMMNDYGELSLDIIKKDLTLCVLVCI